MKNKRNRNKLTFISLIFILSGGLIFLPLGNIPVFAEEEGGSESEKTEEKANSGGFIIESNKVEGEMDILGALGGNVDIKEGIIEGLTITKSLDTGDERGPLIIRITSPGPVPIKDL